MAGFHDNMHTWQSGSNNGKLEHNTPAAQPPIQCPECTSQKVWKDGLRKTAYGGVQRYLCRRCGFRFSQSFHKSHKKINVVNQGRRFQSCSYLTEPTICEKGLSSQKLMDNLSLSGSKDIGSHTVTITGKHLNSLRSYSCKHRVCASEKEAKNLTEMEARQEIAQREGTLPAADVKGKLVKFAWWLQKEGYGSAKNRLNMLKRLVDLGANLEDPESVKNILAKNQNWTEGYKMLLMYAYESFLKMEGHSWKRPRYRQTKTLPFIPTEEELDQLINGSGKKLGTFLQGLKDTGADPGELAKLTWIDLNVEARTVNITPVKGHKPRVLRVSDQFITRVQNLPKGSQSIFNYVSLRPAFLKAKKFLARKLSNPRLLAITFTTFRHWKGTMEYHLTHDIIYVKEMLGHRRIDNTMVYINLETTIFSSKNDQFYAAVATTSDEAIKLIEAGFDFVTGEYNDGGKLFRKRK
jgi:integrase